jgi:Ser-tRNA(Ala) deacylase AlaX
VEKYLLKTEKDYFLDTYKFEAKAKLIDILETPKGLSLVFDRTIFHPQGGG